MGRSTSILIKLSQVVSGIRILGSIVGKEVEGNTSIVALRNA
jgi:hypothetical protein